MTKINSLSPVLPAISSPIQGQNLDKQIAQNKTPDLSQQPNPQNTSQPQQDKLLQSAEKSYLANTSPESSKLLGQAGPLPLPSQEPATPSLAQQSPPTAPSADPPKVKASMSSVLDAMTEALAETQKERTGKVGKLVSPFETVPTDKMTKDEAIDELEFFRDYLDLKFEMLEDGKVKVQMPAFDIEFKREVSDDQTSKIKSMTFPSPQHALSVVRLADWASLEGVKEITFRGFHKPEEKAAPEKAAPEKPAVAPPTSPFIPQTKPTNVPEEDRAEDKVPAATDHNQTPKPPVETNKPSLLSPLSSSISSFLKSDPLKALLSPLSKDWSLRPSLPLWTMDIAGFKGNDPKTGQPFDMHANRSMIQFSHNNYMQSIQTHREEARRQSTEQAKREEARKAEDMHRYRFEEQRRAEESLRFEEQRRQHQQEIEQIQARRQNPTSNAQVNEAFSAFQLMQSTAPKSREVHRQNEISDSNQSFHSSESTYGFLQASRLHQLLDESKK